MPYAEWAILTRKLGLAGAEVIAWPVWGCDPLLARARACENHVYLVSSTCEDVSRNRKPQATLFCPGFSLTAPAAVATYAKCKIPVGGKRRTWR